MKKNWKALEIQWMGWMVQMHWTSRETNNCLDKSNESRTLYATIKKETVFFGYVMRRTSSENTMKQLVAYPLHGIAFNPSLCCSWYPWQLICSVVCPCSLNRSLTHWKNPQKSKLPVYGLNLLLQHARS